MKRSEAVNKLDKWFKLVECNRLPDFAKTPGEYLMWFLETHIEMRPPYDVSQDDEVDTCEWENE